ncbi:MAG TPA: glycosyltransferase family 1 protein [Acidimicrobiales bacterium]|nr:glycosyltransferase family 1 protein [Acidimicrobiales bacterium]
MGQPESQPRLRVAVDATPLLGVRTGVGTFTQCALEALAGRPELDVSAFAVSWRRRGRMDPHLPGGVRAVTRPMPARPLHRAWSVGGLPPLEWFTGPADVVHGTNYVVPPTRSAARVMTVHDLTSVRWPELCDDYTRTFPRLVRRALSEGAWVHTPSQFVAAEVVELLGAEPGRVRAVHHGIPPLPAPTDPADEAPLLPRKVERYVLALGTIEPRKDLPTLVRAFDRLAADVADLWLVVAGPDGWGVAAYEESVAAATHRSRILRVGYVGAAQRSVLLGQAAVYAFPSLYEGFGLPPLEAMAVGVPVVCTDAGALPEVVGDAAALVPVGDPDALAGAIARLVTDSEARRSAIERGRARTAAFSWEAAAAGLSRLYADARSDAAGR